MYNVSSEQQERIANASYVASYLAQKGFSVYCGFYEYRVVVEIMTDTYAEALQVIEAMQGRTDLYKKRDIKPRRPDDGQRWYVIRYQFK